MRKFSNAAILFSGLLLSTSTLADVKPEAAIVYRQSLYHVILWNYLPLADMVKGKTPFDAKEAARRAERIAAVVPQLLEGFPKGSDTGAKTEAKAEIWNNFADFESKMNDFVKESRALVDAVKTSDEEKFKAQFQKTSGTCKACHEKYKAE